MNVLILAEYVSDRPWSADSWAARVARGLASRGHGVVLACDSAFDASALAGVRTFERPPRRRDENRRPLRFHLWARGVLRRLPHDVSLSLTALAPADLSLPVGPGAWESLKSAWAGGRLFSAAFETAQRPWHAGAIAAERLSALGAAPRRRLALAGVPGALGSHELGLASRWPTPEPRAFGALRETARRALGVDPSRTVFLLSAVHPERPGLPAMLEALAALQGTRERPAPVVIAAGPRAYAVHAEARRARCAAAVRCVGGTARMDALLAACDVAAAPLAGRGAGGTGRFIADALRHGRPVIAERGVRGAELLGPQPDGARPGWALERATASTWRTAMEDAMSPRREHAAIAASAVGATLSFESLLTRLEVFLEDAARAAAHRPRPALAATACSGSAVS